MRTDIRREFHKRSTGLQSRYRRLVFVTYEASQTVSHTLRYLVVRKQEPGNKKRVSHAGKTQNRLQSDERTSVRVKQVRLVNGSGGHAFLAHLSHLEPGIRPVNEESQAQFDHEHDRNDDAQRKLLNNS